MKLFKYLTILSLTLWLSSCGDPELPFDTFHDVKHGAYARQLSLTGEFNFFDPAGSTYDWEVEFYDENSGQNVDSYTWTVAYDDRSAGNNDVGPVDFASYSSADFSTNERGLPGLSDSFGFDDALTALGLDISDVNGGDAIVFQATVTKTDGQSFTVTNTGTNIIGSASFRAFFTLNAAIICPSDLSGVFDYSTEGWCGATQTGQIEWADEGSGVYTVVGGDFSYGAYLACYAWDGTPDGSLAIQDACGILTPTGADQWGDTYMYNSVVSAGADLTIDWENTYGEAGVTTLTRTDGNDWPSLTN